MTFQRHHGLRIFSPLNAAQIINRTVWHVDIFLDFALSKIYSLRPMKK